VDFYGYLGLAKQTDIAELCHRVAFSKEFLIKSADTFQPYSIKPELRFPHAKNHF